MNQKDVEMLLDMEDVDAAYDAGLVVLGGAGLLSPIDNHLVRDWKHAKVTCHPVLPGRTIAIGYPLYAYPHYAALLNDKIKELEKEICRLKGVSDDS